MMPPICAICHKPFSAEEGALLQFQLSQEDSKFNKRFEQPGFTGHPKGMQWICPQHLELAKTYTGSTWEEASKRLTQASIFGKLLSCLFQWWRR